MSDAGLRLCVPAGIAARVRLWSHNTGIAHAHSIALEAVLALGAFPDRQPVVRELEDRVDRAGDELLGVGLADAVFLPFTKAELLCSPSEIFDF